MKRIAWFTVFLFAAAGCSSVRGTEPAMRQSAASIAAARAAQQRLIAIGRSQFLHCNSCHVVDAAAPPPFGADQGPHLEGIVGRRAAGVDGFAYTDALRALDLVWTEEALDVWLQQPQAMVSGMCEPFLGMADAEQRQALIEYLKNPPDR